MTQTATRKYHSLGGLESKTLFFTVLEAGKYKIEVPEDWFLVRALFLPLVPMCSLGPSLVQGTEERQEILSLLIRPQILSDF